MVLRSLLLSSLKRSENSDKNFGYEFLVNLEQFYLVLNLPNVLNPGLLDGLSKKPGHILLIKVIFSENNRTLFKDLFCSLLEITALFLTKMLNSHLRYFCNPVL
jgi:hypothetical protein